MKHICPECGSEIPEDSDFCFSCGRKKDDTIVLDDSGHFIDSNENKCTACGTELGPLDLFCPSCGKPTTKEQMIAFRPKMRKYGWIGILLAVIPGIFNLCGLGHLYFRKWGRAAMYLAISAMMMYIRYGGFEMGLFTQILFILVSGFIFVMQAFETYILAFVPPKTPE